MTASSISAEERPMPKNSEALKLREETGLQSLADWERQYVLKAYEQCGQNKSMTALVLGIDRRTLYRKLASYEEQDRREA